LGWGGGGDAGGRHMTRKPDEASDVSLVERLIFGQPGITLQRFEDREIVAGSTPDFKVLRCANLVAFCEVKSPRDDWLEGQIMAVPPGQIAGGVRSDPTFNRLARHVKKAASQFNAVNAGRAVPNILVFVNHADASHAGDLIETLTGTCLTDSGERIPTVRRHISERWIGQARHQIDLYIWIDRKTSSVQYLFNDEASTPVVAGLCDLLGLDPSNIRR